MIDMAVNHDDPHLSEPLRFVRALIFMECSQFECALLVLLSVFAIYLIAVRSLRYHRRDTQASRYGFMTPDSFELMTVNEAQAIQAEYATLESPQMFFSMSRLGLLKVRSALNVVGVRTFVQIWTRTRTYEYMY